MYDYTPEGFRARQADLTVAYLNLIDSKLAKINRKLTIITMLAIGVAVYKNKDVITAELKKMKGE